MQSETPIFDAMVLEYALNDQEGKDAVTAIHVRKGYLPPAPDRNGLAYHVEPGLMSRVALPARLVHVLGGAVPMTVHNHNPDQGRGLECPERMTPEGLKGACMVIAEGAVLSDLDLLMASRQDPANE